MEFLSAVSKKKSKMSQPIRSQGSHFVFLIGPKNTNLVEDVEILLSVKFQPSVSANQRSAVQPVKHKLMAEDIEILLHVSQF